MVAPWFFLLAWVQFPLFTSRNFFAFFFTCLPAKIGSPCTNKAFWKKINAHRLPICIPLCARWVCSTDLQSRLRLYMVPEDTNGSTRQWSSGMHHVLLILRRGFKSRAAFFGFFLSLVLLRKLVCHAQTKLARRRGMHTGFPFASHCVLGGCAALICNQSYPTVVNLMGNLLLHAPTPPATRRQMHTGIPWKHCWPSIL